MKPKYPESKHRRIILLYALAVLLPGLLLAVMAWRGIQNDQARREKEGRDRLQGISDRFNQSMDSILVASMNSLTGGRPEEIKSDLPGYCTLAFYQAGLNDVRLLRHHLIYLPDSLNPATTGLRDQSSDSFAQDLAAIRIFRSQNKPMQALAAWNQLEKRFPTARLYGKIPLKLTAVAEKAKIFNEMNQSDSLDREKILLTQLLINPPVEYEAAQFRFFKNLIADLPEKNTLLMDSLSGILRAKREETDFYIRLIMERNPLFLDGNSEQNGVAIGLRKFPFTRNEVAYVYLTAEAASADRYGMVINLGELVKSRSAEILFNLDPAGDLSWAVLNDQKMNIRDHNVGAGNNVIHFDLTGNFSGWQLLLRENKVKWVDGILSKGTGTYLLIFLFIGLIMILGLIFTMYTLNQELKLNRLKSDFIANVSHELKSPLTSIRHLMDLLHNNRVKSDDQRKRYYATMIEQTEHLGYLIENILDFSRLEDNRKKYRIKEADYNELLNGWLGQLDDHARSLGIQIERAWASGLPKLWIDPDAIQQVIFNLVDNALKYSADSKRIEISVEVEGDEIRTSIRDWGFGIARKDLDKVFDRFYRCEDNLFRGIKGSGIGLTIVRKIVSDHGGRITVDSSQGAGSTFTFYLPVNAKPNHEENTGS